MIARLEGVLRDKSPTRVVLDVGGVGYEILVPLSTYAELPEEGKTVALRVHTHVREDAIQLFGFQSERERVLFELLIRTSGVGPKLAQAILSGLAPEDLVEALRSGAVATLRGIPGVGTKTAERIVVELRDRATELAEPSEARRAEVTRPPETAAERRAVQAVSALVNLGTPRGRADRVVEEAGAELAEGEPLEALVRAALRRLSR